MSWVRMGSPCWSGGTGFACDECPDCPGSSVYVYEEGDDRVVCCMCALSENDPTLTEDGMREHLRAHVAAGHHVRKSLLMTDEEYNRTHTEWLQSLTANSDAERTK